MSLLRELRTDYEKIKTLGGEVIAVAMEAKKADALDRVISRTKAPFPVLNGAGGKWREHYQYLYTYLIDATGTVRAVFGGTVHTRHRGVTVVRAFEKMVKKGP